MTITIRVLSVSASLLSLLASGSAFSASLRHRTPSRIYSENTKTNVVSDVQEAVELLEDQLDSSQSVHIKNDMSKPDVTKEELMLDVQETLEQATEETSEDQPVQGLTNSKEKESPALSPQPKAKLAADIGKKLRFEQEHTVEEAAVSASLYMNPATAKIAPHVQITWEPEAAETLLHLEKASNPNRPFMVGLVGIPGSGKSTSADILAAILGDDRAIVMPMDGFHYSLAELADFPDPTDAVYRRGAPDTFDAKALQVELSRIAHGDEPSVTIPGFDHAVGDPTPDQHTFDRGDHRIVICEGIYLLHDDHGWDQIKSFFDWTIYIDADVDICIDRLKTRNKCIPGYTPEEIELRCDEVDRVNAITSRDGAYKYASQIVKSGASSTLKV